MYSIEKVNTSQFFYTRWRAGCLKDLGLHHRKYSIIEGKDIIKKYAIGYCQGECLPVRPKENTFAVMFYKDGEYFWTHLIDYEFKYVFNKKGEI